jgi:hypothetical protein
LYSLLWAADIMADNRRAKSKRPLTKRGRNPASTGSYVCLSPGTCSRSPGFALRSSQAVSSRISALDTRKANIAPAGSRKVNVAATRRTEGILAEVNMSYLSCRYRHRAQFVSVQLRAAGYPPVYSRARMKRSWLLVFMNSPGITVELRSSYG